MPNLYSTNYFQWLDLESWVIKLEKLPFKAVKNYQYDTNNLFIKFTPKTEVEN